MILIFAMAACAPVAEIPDAWTRADEACAEPVPWFDVKFVRPIETLERRPSAECEAVLREDFGIASDVGLSAAWSLVLWPVDPDAYDEAAFYIDEVIDGPPAVAGAWASFDRGVVVVSAPEVVGYIGASVLVHEAAHAWAPGHVRCLGGEKACDHDDAGTVGAQVRYLDEVIGAAEDDGHSRGGTVGAVRSFRDDVYQRIATQLL